MSTAEVKRQTIGDLDGTPITLSRTEAPGLLGFAVAAYVVAGMHRPHWSRLGRLWLASFWFALYVLADTFHTLGHVRSSRQVGAPIDSVRLALGIQVTEYAKNDVEPRQHIGRAIGGPIASGALTFSAYPLYKIFRRVPILSVVAEAWLVSNALVLGIALIPTPHFDGASILKWTTVQRTGNERLADETVQTAGKYTIAGLLLAALILLVRGKWRAAGLAILAAITAAVDLYILKGSLPS